MAKRRYSDEERAEALAALAANGSNIQRTAEQLGIPWTTLRHWLRGDRHPEASQMGEQKKPLLADAAEDKAHRVLGFLTDDKIKKMTGDKIAVTFAILVDKTRLLRGEATSISGTEILTDEQRITRLNAMARTAQARGVEQAHADGTGGSDPVDATPPAVDPVAGTADGGVQQPGG